MPPVPVLLLSFVDVVEPGLSRRLAAAADGPAAVFGGCAHQYRQDESPRARE